MTKTFVFSLVLLSAVMAQNASADLVTASAQLNGTQTIINFSQFTGGNQHNGVNGPVQIGALVGDDVTASSTTNALWLYNQSWGLLDNGTWDSGRNGYLGVWPNDGPVAISFNFAENVSGFGAFMNYIPNFTASIQLRAFDSNGILLEVYDIQALAPISTPGGVNAGAFRGIERQQADIARAEFFGQGAVYDDLAYVKGSASAVPEPQSYAAWLAVGLGLIGYLRRRSKLMTPSQ